MNGRTLSVALLLGLVLPVAAGAQSADARLRVLGEMRVRGEAERAAVVDSSDAWTLLRARVALEAELTERAMVFAQLQDARTFGEEQGTLDGSANRLDLHQAWLQYRSATGRVAWSVRAGRQEVAIGNERLVGPVGWSNTGRAFDGVVAGIGREPVAGATQVRWNVGALSLQERGRRTAAAPADRSDDLLLATWLDTRWGEAWLLHDRVSQQRTFADVARSTLGARVVTPSSRRLTAAVEASYQFGAQDVAAGAGPVTGLEQDVRAWMAGARVAYAVDAGVLRRVGAGVDVLSGDDAPFDDTYGAFNTLYATNHKFYGFIDQFLDPAARTQDRGLVDGMLSAALGSGSKVLAIDAHLFRTQQARQTDDARDLGWELDLTLPVQLGPGQVLHFGYSIYRTGAASPLVGTGAGGRTWHWGYVQATFSFGGRPAPVL